MLKFILTKPILTKTSFSPGIKDSPQYDLIRLEPNILPLKIRETQRGRESLASLLYFDIRHNNDGGVAPSNRLQHFLLRVRIKPKFLNFSWNFPKCPPETESGNSSLVAQCLNQMQHQKALIWKKNRNNVSNNNQNTRRCAWSR